MSDFERAADEALPVLGPAGLRALADRIAAGWTAPAVLADVRPRHHAATSAMLDTLAETPANTAACYLRGLATGYAQHAAATSVEPVWSGPGTHAVPVRATAQALIDVVTEATSELLLMTYSATSHEALRDALEAAAGRGVTVTVVVETLQGAGSALAGAEPAAAFAGLRGVSLWHWPSERRSEPGAKMHAKLAVADRRTLLVSSANLTQSGVSRNIEAGVLLRGGSAPGRAAEHIEALRARGVLAPLSC